MRIGSSIRVLSLASILPILIISSAMQADPDSGSARVVEFPEDMENLYVKFGNFGEYNPQGGNYYYNTYHQGEWSKEVPARGRMTIPEGQGMWLVKRGKGPRLDEVIRKIGPDDLFIMEGVWPHMVKDLACFEGKRSLRCLELVNSTPAMVASLPVLEGLQQLIIGGHDCRDVHECAHLLAPVAKLPAIRSLQVHVWNLPVSALGDLEALPLEELDLWDCRIHSSGVESIAKISTLRRLNLADNTSVEIILKAEDLKPLAQLTSLRELNLSGNSRLLNNCDNQNFISHGDLRFLESLKELEKLSLDGVNLDGASLAVLSKLTSLKSLSLAHNWHAFQAPDSLDFLRPLTRLEALNINDAPVSDDHLGPILALTALKELSLNHTRITDDGMAGLGALPKLRTLSVMGLGMRVTEKGANELRLANPNIWIMMGPIRDERYVQ